MVRVLSTCVQLSDNYCILESEFEENFDTLEVVMNEKAGWLQEILVQHLLCIRNLSREDVPHMDSKNLSGN